LGLKRGIDKTVEVMVKEIGNRSRKVESKEMIAQVASCFGG
jgi:hypothetical protein